MRDRLRKLVNSRLVRNAAIFLSAAATIIAILAIGNAATSTSDDCVWDILPHLADAILALTLSYAALLAICMHYMHPYHLRNWRSLSRISKILLLGSAPIVWLFKIAVDHGAADAYIDFEIGVTEASIASTALPVMFLYFSIQIASHLSKEEKAQQEMDSMSS